MAVITAKKSAAERLQSAKVALPKLERERDVIMAARRECLLNDDVAGRRRCDHQLRELRDDLQAVYDKIELLGRAGPQVVQEHTGWTWPTSLPDTNAALAQLQPELLRLRSIKPVNRSATDDDHLNSLVKREYALLRQRESMQPKEAR